MANRIEPSLIKPLYEELQKERFVVVATVDHLSGGPYVNAISWILAKDEKTVYFAIDNRSKAVANIKNNNQVVINMIANETVYSISGEATIRTEEIEDVPLKLALVELRIQEVRDVMFYGSVITEEPAYNKSYDKLAASRLDSQVMEALRKA